MGYSIVSGKYFYEKGGDYFTFNALIDEMDHSGAGSFKNGQKIEDESINPYTRSPGFFKLTDVENYSGDPWKDSRYDMDYWDVTSYYDAESGLTKDEVSGTGYDNGLPGLSSYGMEGEVKVNGSFLSFNTTKQLDFLVPKTGYNKIKGSDKSDLLKGTAGNDIINGGSGLDTAVFSGKNNRINLNTTKAQNTGDGKDRLIAIENVNAGSGNDVVTGNKANNTLNGQNGNDKLNGAAGNDVLIGGNGNDVLSGGSGDDIIDGGKGLDKMTGGSGTDYFVLNSGVGYGKIMDFDVAEDWIYIDSDFYSMSVGDSGKNLDIFRENDLVAKVMGLAGMGLVNDGDGFMYLG